MNPGNALAVGFLLSLLPGWVFLRTTQQSRLPRAQSALGESLELLAVGVATTGASALATTLWQPALVIESVTPSSPDELRTTVVLGLVILLGATGLSLIASHVFCRLYPVRFGSSVWHETLSTSLIPLGELNFLGVETAEERVFEGVQHAYTHGSEDSHRDIALKAPIYSYNNKNLRFLTPYSFVVIPNDSIRHIAVVRMSSGPPAAGTVVERGCQTGGTAGLDAGSQPHN